jgi:DNA-binding XRE family transcriptional regulator
MIRAAYTCKFLLRSIRAPYTFRVMVTTIRKLREITTYDQIGFASTVGCSYSTIQSLELGRLKLSTKMADQIRQVTGINLEWLFGDKNPKAKVPQIWKGDAPIDEFQKPYTRETFKRRQSRFVLGKKGDVLNINDQIWMRRACLDVVTRYLKTMKKSIEQGEWHLAFYKLNQSLIEVEKEYGTARNYFRTPLGLGHHPLRESALPVLDEIDKAIAEATVKPPSASKSSFPHPKAK